MQNTDTALRKIFMGLGALLGWFALIAQFYLAVDNRTSSVAEAVIRYFSYFTILTNGLAVIAFTVLLSGPESSWGIFFGRPSTLTAIAVYITVVGVTYNLILRSIWNPQGLQWIVDELLHVVMPVLFVLFWLMFVARGARLPWKVIFGWMIFPLLYCVYSLGRGAMVGYYPYPFLDVRALGYEKVFIAIAWMIGLFFGLALLLVGITRIAAPRR